MIPVVCTRCGSGELRLHGTIYEAMHRPRWLFWGPLEVHRHVIGHDWSCRMCFFAFTTIRGRIIGAPAQTLHEAVGTNRLREQEDERPKEPKLPALDLDVQRDPRDSPRRR